MTNRARSEHVERVLSVAVPPGRGQPAGFAPHIASSWERCLKRFKLDPDGAGGGLVIDSPRLRERQEMLGDLLELARTVSEDLFQQINGSGFSVLFTDKEGIITHYVGDPGAQPMFARAGLRLGADWSEAQEGTNGIGTCLAEARPVTVHLDQHFRASNTRLSCSGAPVYGPEGELIAVLDVSSVQPRETCEAYTHTQSLVNMAAQTIERCYFLRRFNQQRVLHFHTQPEFLGLPTDGMLALDGDDRIVGVNAHALRHLGVAQRGSLLGRPVRELLDVQAHLLSGAARSVSIICPLRRRGADREFYGLMRGPMHPAGETRKAPSPRAPRESAEGRCLSLHGLAGKDPGMAYNVRLAERVMNNKRVSVLLLGETGTGKDAFARAIHEASERAHKPFVALNCAAIPASLIESELFGYKHGAFTGARREGLRGKLVQSSGGTLFLDEIGDMPPELQTRLLRVLEEREVVPLGGDTPIQVDLSVISATHRNLEELVREQRFREDLFYRLNGITLTLPPLRERADRESLIACAVRLEDDLGREVRIDDEAFGCLLAHPWPGNIRELRNVVRTALALCEDGLIRLSDLPRHIACPRRDAAAVPIPAGQPSEPVADDPSPLESAERETIVRKLEENRWNVTTTAAQLQMSRNTLYRKMRKHGIGAAAGR